MKKIMVIFLVIICSLCLCSCEKTAVTEQPPKEEVKEQEAEIQKPSLVFEDSWGRNTPKFNGMLYDGQEYQLVSDGNKYFLRYNIYTPKPFFLSGYWTPISFESNNELQKYLYDEERVAEDRTSIQWHFRLDERKYVPLLNIEKEYYPTTPDGFNCDGSITWWGSSIRFMARNPVYRDYFYITIYEDDIFYEVYEKQKFELDKEEKCILLKEEWEKDRNAIERYYLFNASDKEKCHIKTSMYEIIQEDKKMIVLEEYRFNPIVGFDDGAFFSENYSPKNCEIFGCDKGVKFIVQMSHTSGYYERPSVDFLSKIGVRTVDVDYQKQCNTK